MKSFVDRFVHLGVAVDSAEHERHRRFITASSVASAVGLGIVPFLIAGYQTSPGLWAGASAIAGIPFLLAVFVSRTGRIDAALNVTALTLAGLAGFALAITAAPPLPLLLVASLICLEPAFWSMRRPVAKGLAMAVVAALVPYVWSVPQLPVPVLQDAPTMSLAIWWIIAAIYFSACLYRISRNAKDTDLSIGKAANDFESLAANTRDLVTIHNRDGTVREVLSCGLGLTDVTAADIKGTGLSAKIHLQDRIAFLKAGLRCWHSRGHQTVRLRMRDKGGSARSWVWMEMVAQPQFSMTGAVEAVIISGRDITAHVELESELREERQERERASAAQKRFLATMSHELRTPLNAIVGFSDILEQELFGRLEQDRHREYVSHIHASGQHLLSIVNDMLDMSRIEAGRYELDVIEFQLEDLVQKTLGMMQPLATKAQVAVSHRIGENLPGIRSDRRSWQQILVNLVSNAIKFTPKGGSIHLAARQFGRNIKIEVRDTGIGIDPEFLSSIGEPFLQAETGPERRFGGTGLGLFVVKGLVDLNGGDLQIDSAPGKGTTVTVLLPMQAPAAQPRPHTENTRIVSIPEERPDDRTANQSNSSVANKGDSHARLSA